jgi:hypothetical protein
VFFNCTPAVLDLQLKPAAGNDACRIGLPCRPMRGGIKKAPGCMPDAFTRSTHFLDFFVFFGAADFFVLDVLDPDPHFAIVLSSFFRV